jgi:hypothetical protein
LEAVLCKILINFVFFVPFVDGFWLFLSIGKDCDALIDRAAFFIAHLHPAGDFIECPQTAAAHVVAQNGRAIPDTRALCSDRFGGRRHQDLL